LEVEVAANRQQGSCLLVFLLGFTFFPAGLIAWATHPIVAVLLTLAGLALLIHSLVGFRRIKHLEYREGN
jgi:Flp pilus assembly protein TadB